MSAGFRAFQPTLFQKVATVLQGKTEVTLVEFQKATDLPTTVAYNEMLRLRRHKFLERGSEPGRYKLTSKFINKMAE